MRQTNKTPSECLICLILVNRMVTETATYKSRGCARISLQGLVSHI